MLIDLSERSKQADWVVTECLRTAIQQINKSSFVLINIEYNVRMSKQIIHAGTQPSSHGQCSLKSATIFFLGRTGISFLLLNRIFIIMFTVSFPFSFFCYSFLNIYTVNQF